MVKYSAEYVYNVLEEAGADVRDDYSGRAMYGKTCPAVEGNMNNFLRIIADIAKYDYVLASYLAETADFDSMGMDSVMYWPNITYD